MTAAVPLPPTAAVDDEPAYHHAVSTRNACKLCTPLGACLAFRGIEGCLPFLHGSQAVSYTHLTLPTICSV